MCKLLTLARLFQKDFDRATKEDLKELVATLDLKYKAWTKMKLRLALKRFFKWLKQGDDYLTLEEYPDEVRWIKRSFGKRDEPRIQRNQCWNEQEIKKLLAAATHPRDRALIAILTETGARVGEVGSLRIGDVYQDEFSYLIHLKGKTGERDDRVIYSGPYLAQWLNVHPQRDDPQAPLFTKKSHPGPLRYGGILSLLRKLARRSGLQHKKCNPHIFRHSRATLMAEQGWPEPIIKEYLGWQKDSDMMSTYSHLTSRQANSYVLKVHGLGKAEPTKPTLKAQLCATCHQQNGPAAKFCRRCGRPLSHEAILKYNHCRNEASDILNQLVEDPEFVNGRFHCCEIPIDLFGYLFPNIQLEVVNPERSPASSPVFQATAC